MYIYAHDVARCIWFSRTHEEGKTIKLDKTQAGRSRIGAVFQRYCLDMGHSAAVYMMHHHRRAV